ncbi:MAG: L,D-transpeptidase [Verrucomicrobiaceae bacterium]|nr:MAG: L,D-transpeptidase [Verrucomicrobiaceae bacterium]
MSHTSRQLVVSIDDQTLRVIEGGTCIREFPVSTAIKGMGFTEGSHRTPTGNFRICEKIGAGHASGTIFKARLPVGIWQPGEAPDEDLVLTRILRLDGLDPANTNTLARYVYIHGTNREDLIGSPAGHGCVRLRNDDMIDLFDRVEENDSLEILPATRPRGKLLFIDFDSTLARPAGGYPPAAVVESIAQAMQAGWLPVLLASSPESPVETTARALGITHFEVPASAFEEAGFHARKIREWLAAYLPEKTAMLGGTAPGSDLEPLVDSWITQDAISGMLDA